MLDEALLRPGRLEVQIEIGLPDEEGRLQILKIHTSRMDTNSFLSRDVDLAKLAELTKNYSGAEIEGLCKSAASFALNRHVDVNDLSKPIDEDNIKVWLSYTLLYIGFVHWLLYMGLIVECTQPSLILMRVAAPRIQPPTD